MADLKIPAVVSFKTMYTSQFYEQVLTNLPCGPTTTTLALRATACAHCSHRLYETSTQHLSKQSSFQGKALDHQSTPQRRRWPFFNTVRSHGPGDVSCSQLNLPPLTVHKQTQVPVPKVLAWNADASNPVGVEYIVMEKAPGVQLFKVWGDMNDRDHLSLVKQLTEFESQMANVRFPANGSLYLTKSMVESDRYVALERNMDPSGEFCISPSCERGWHTLDNAASSVLHSYQGPYKCNIG